jgi:hypothetical protein
MPKNRFSRVIITTLLAAAAAVGSALPASAQEDSEPLVLPAGVACPFELQISLTGGNLEEDPRNLVGAERGRPVRLVTAAGSTGTLTLVNLDTDESISFRSKGVGQTEVSEGGTTTVSTGGQLLLVLFPNEPGGPSTTLYTGRVVYTVDETTGIFTVQSTTGQAVDVCAALED